MKVALIHDYLNQYGGAERVLEALLKIFPGAHLYTLLHSRERTGGRFEKYLTGTSFLNLDFVNRHHRPFIPFMPFAVERMNLGDRYDLVISDSAGFAKGITVDPRTFHLSYCHTPLRYAWEVNDYFKNPIFKAVFKPAFAYLRNWDYRAGRRPQAVIANSRFIAAKISHYYNRAAKVVYPPVDENHFYYESLPRGAKTGGYYLAAGRLLNYKRFDLAIDAFARLNVPLKIVGSGPEEKKLKERVKKLNAAHIEFIPFVTEDELRRLYRGAKAFIFPQVEDFGLVAAEAIACGAPVVAFHAGGALEIVKEGVSGVFFDRQTVNDLLSAIARFEKIRWSRARISASAASFSFAAFKKGILSALPVHLRSLSL